MPLKLLSIHITCVPSALQASLVATSRIIIPIDYLCVLDSYYRLSVCARLLRYERFIDCNDR